jgi:hypothetical protein
LQADDLFIIFYSLCRERLKCLPVTSQIRFNMSVSVDGFQERDIRSVKTSISPLPSLLLVLSVKWTSFLLYICCWRLHVTRIPTVSTVTRKIRGVIILYGLPFCLSLHISLSTSFCFCYYSTAWWKISGFFSLVEKFVCWMFDVSILISIWLGPTLSGKIYSVLDWAFPTEAAEFLTKSMELSPSWEAATCAPSQEFLNILWYPKIHYYVHKSAPPVHVLSQINPVHSTPPCRCNIHF